jgi:hypothetical protein
MIERQRKLISIESKDSFLIHSLLVTGEFEKSEDLYNTPILIMVISWHAEHRDNCP